MATQVELTVKSCPFCGTEAHLYLLDFGQDCCGDYRDEYIVGCTTRYCPCDIDLARRIDTWPEEEKVDRLAAWNRRAISSENVGKPKDDTFQARPKLVNLPRMARLLGVTAKWLRSEANLGAIPHIKADKRFLFDEEAVYAVLLERAGQCIACDNRGVSDE